MSQLNSSEESYMLLGVDVGGTNIRVLGVDQNLKVQGQASAETDTTSNAMTLDSIACAIERALSQMNVHVDQVRAVGMGVPGRVEDGVVELAVNLNFGVYPLAAELSKRFKMPFKLENDVRTAALGAYLFVREREPVNNLAYLNIGTGISAGLILDGELYRGSHGMAGEIGHMIVEPDGPECTCGASGCLESIASGRAIARRGLQAVREKQETLLAKFDPLTAESVYQAAQRKDRVAQEIVQDASAYLSRAIHWLIMTYDVERLVLGGGVSHSGQAFLNPILKELERIRAQSDLARSMLSTEKIVLLPNNFDAGTWGAVLLAKRMLPRSELTRVNA